MSTIIDWELARKVLITVCSPTPNAIEATKESNAKLFLLGLAKTRESQRITAFIEDADNMAGILGMDYNDPKIKKRIAPVHYALNTVIACSKTSKGKEILKSHREASLLDLMKLLFNKSPRRDSSHTKDLAEELDKEFSIQIDEYINHIETRIKDQRKQIEKMLKQTTAEAEILINAIEGKKERLDFSRLDKYGWNKGMSEEDIKKKIIDYCRLKDWHLKRIFWTKEMAEKHGAYVMPANHKTHVIGVFILAVAMLHSYVSAYKKFLDTEQSDLIKKKKDLMKLVRRNKLGKGESIKSAMGRLVAMSAELYTQIEKDERFLLAKIVHKIHEIDTVIMPKVLPLVKKKYRFNPCLYNKNPVYGPAVLVTSFDPVTKSAPPNEEFRLRQIADDARIKTIKIGKDYSQCNIVLDHHEQLVEAEIEIKKKYCTIKPAQHNIGIIVVRQAKSGTHLFVLSTIARGGLQMAFTENNQAQWLPQHKFLMPAISQIVQQYKTALPEFLGSKPLKLEDKDIIIIPKGFVAEYKLAPIYQESS